MKPLAAGQAALARIDGKVALVAYDLREHFTMDHASFQIRGGLHQVNIANVMVPAVSIVLRLTAGNSDRYYWAWVNELEESVIELLANQAELPIILACPLGESLGRTILSNGIRDMARRCLGTISRCAAESPWCPQHFAAARVFVEWDYPTAEKEWAALDSAARHP